MGKKIVIFEPGRCWGCGNCAIRCAEAHNGESRCWVVWAGPIPVSTRCLHCSDAACMDVCPVGAITRRGDAVVIDYDSCKGCGLCALACPFGAIAFDPQKKKPIKCDLCIDIVEKGGTPACVEACPSHALQYIDIDELTAKNKRRLAYTIKYLTTGNPEDLVEALYRPVPYEWEKELRAQGQQEA